MSDFRINQALQEMQRMAQAAGGTQGGPQKAEGADFGDLLKRAVDGVNGLQGESMIASQKARVGFEAMKEVRNRLLEAYQTVSRMQV